MSWQDLYRETIESIASLLWGLLSVTALFALAVWQGSLLGAGLAVLAAGLTYVFQEAVRHVRVARVLQLVPAIVWLAAFLVVVIGV